MEASPALIPYIKRKEGFRQRVYADAEGYPTVGWGHRLLNPASFPDGVTEELAEHMLACDVDDAESAVNRLVRVPLSQGQFDALVDFVFNLGSGRLASSTLLRDLNELRYDEASLQILRWDHAGMKVLEGLEERRRDEYDMWHGLFEQKQATAAPEAAA